MPRSVLWLSLLCLPLVACSGGSKQDDDASTDTDAQADTDVASVDTDGGGSSTPVCGDGTVADTEACDDGDLEDGDGCSASCTVEPYTSCSGSPSTCCVRFWGTASPAYVADGEFSTDFVNSTTASNYSTTQWTALSVFDGIGTPGAAYWTRSVGGASLGGFTSGAEVGSPTSGNGVALFDSDYLDNGGLPSGIGRGPSPALHRGELVSPRVDLTGHGGGRLVAQFFASNRNFDTRAFRFGFSTDDGATWRGEADLPIGVSNDVVLEGQVAFEIANGLPDVTDLTRARFRFVFDGDGYTSAIDDLFLSECFAPE